MKQVKRWFFSVCILLPLAVFAGEVNETDARKHAVSFLATRGKQLSAKSPLKLSVRGRRQRGTAVGPAAYYVFNVPGADGFVIVSGDDRTETILGYADEGSLTEDGMPDGLRYLLDGYAEQVAWLDSHPEAVSATPLMTAAVRTPIAPLVQTHWNQGTPYNNNCPVISETRTVTGCVATSMAQLMYYHQWPTAATTAIPGYTTKTKDANKTDYQLTVDGLDATTFSWNAMSLGYSSTDTGTAAAAVAVLMQYCGASLQMKYGLSANGGSSAYSEAIPEALKTYFGYDGGVRHTYRKNYSYAEWVDLIYSELASRRPVALGGQSTGGGHSFVCDGYDTNDYFHINWGWGGSSDGYYRLSALNPKEQGLGGSSSLDGFSFGQDAVIGIQPPVGGNEDYCLSLEGLRLGSPDGSLASKTFTRDAETGAFTGISLYSLVYCYQYGSHAFDYALQMTDGNGNLVSTLYYSENQTLEWNDHTGGTLSDVTIPSTVADGIYYIKVMSRPYDSTGNTPWQECFDGDRYQLTVTISGDYLTINVPQPTTTLPASAVLTINGNKAVGYEQEVVASVTGGVADYHGGLYLCINDYVVMGKTVEIPAGQTVDVRFAYTPSETGENTVGLYSSYSRDNAGNLISSGTSLGSTTVTIAASDASNTQTLTVASPNITNLANGKLYGNALHVTVNVTKPSSDNSYASKFNCSLREYNSSTADINDFVSTVITKSITIDKSSSTDFTYVFNGLKYGKFYRLRLSYTQGYEEDGKQKTRTVAFEPTEAYEMGEGYAIYTADGTTTIHPSSTPIDGGSAACVDLTSMSSFSGITITASNNPNCVYLLDSDAEVPDALSGKNVVKGSTATTLTLTDGNDFYTPVAFTATSASYTRNFTLAAAGTSGWNSIMLPFTVSSVTCEGLGTVDWFHSSSDTGKNFWLKTFTGDAEGHVYFDFSDEMTANTPYIIAVPGDTWGAAWQMTHKDVTFSGTNVTIQATATSSISGNNYRFCGNTTGQTLSEGYALNDAGSSFTRITASTGIPAFRAWIEGVSISSLTMPALSILNGSPTDGIQEAEMVNGKWLNGKWLDLSGRPVQRPQKPGLYIVGGKKYMVK